MTCNVVLLLEDNHTVPKNDAAECTVVCSTRTIDLDGNGDSIRD